MDTGSTAWILTSAALVLLMTPGLAFFYGGMVRGKSVLNMMMMSWGALALVGVLWILYGYSMAFGNDVGGGLLGDPWQFFGLKGLMTPVTGETLAPFGIKEATPGVIPPMAFVAFQVVFACITAALISGAIADRVKFSTWMIFVGVWVTLVYFPVAHWVFAFTSADGSTVGGWIANNLKAIDFAGGTAVHINSGAAGLALALVIGKRRGFGKEAMRPHNLTLVMLGAGLLWFGWFGFNAGSALTAGTTASVAWVNTFAATCAAMLAWLIVERFRDGHATSLGAASGAVAGLVGITPSCSSVNPVGALLLGAITGAICAFAVSLKYKLGYDDSLDVVGVHMVGGFTGTVLVGFLATSDAPAGVSGLFYGGGVDQLWRQVVGALAVMIYSFVVTYVIALVLKKTAGWRIPDEDEVSGIDQAQHAETGYDLVGSIGGHGPVSGSVLHTTARTSEGASA
ncbi:ammonium transporter [Quadrisphaera oryzae]|uniref:ammonium transporter n=1 Tax=Quadrisphaera TaxID=317661 RepID=UPI0016477965|nr:ammonium transporter [Quadrisphaera sp. RL12-1S]MBC3764044.1 ammonium transporter [Quadrisphaera sp. RL12-1S]